MTRPVLVFVVAVLALVSVVLAAVVMVSRISFLQG